MSQTVTGYLTTQGAAVYTDYSYDHFRGLSRRYNIPRYGNAKNRFAVTDLDNWMKDSECFLEKPTLPSIEKRKLLPIPMQEKKE